MTYPLDQITALARANGELVLKFAEIARTGGEDYAQIGSKATTLFVDQLKELKPGTVPAFRSDGFTSLLGEMEKSREASMSKIKAAVEAWQGSWKDLLSQATGPQELTDSFRTWFQPSAPVAKPEKANVPPPAPAPAKASATA
ncbi:MULTISPECIES: hypothetical protein [Sphingomonadaceae]|uniref:Phasin domain-containing protein n=1 Tax=Sphingomonas sanxanigenens DSM 19645 = NX02 TaxID=1123269 RepID=W0A6J9_9SPHN|nr:MULTISPECIES: hypothetical protein [Sphingomonadaceae]AHE53559.1 hypothetical protein NX02_09190 [Sphingomonas sanxanigenens DSM 19645 = NX02]OAN53353.1 hypothetical protein A7Q26_04820 [Sphingobium sp. TCM1]